MNTTTMKHRRAHRALASAALAAAALLGGCGAPFSAPHAFTLPLRAECGGGVAALYRGVDAYPDGRISAFTRGIGRADLPQALRTDAALVARWNKALDAAPFKAQDGGRSGNLSCALIRGTAGSGHAVRWPQGEAPPPAIAAVFQEMMDLRPDKGR